MKKLLEATAFKAAAFCFVFFALLLFGCVQQAPSQSSSGATSAPQDSAVQASQPEGAAGAISEKGAGNDSQFKEWTAPDGSITLLVPVGWTVTEQRVDSCTVNWAATSPSGTSQAFMTNQILVFKSEESRQLYKQYGLAGIDAAPVSVFLGAEQAVLQVVAPLSGASNVQIAEKDAAASRQLSQAVCAAGLAACDAQVFEATYVLNGISMRGKYLVHSFDFGEGTTWWINLWGYTSPANAWNEMHGTLEKTFGSVRYADGWTAKCKDNAAETSGVINQVVKDRQQSSKTAAEEWDAYIRG